eukprot:1673169-Pleurochrysis_carterae.AAC.2
MDTEFGTVLHRLSGKPGRERHRGKPGGRLRWHLYSFCFRQLGDVAAIQKYPEDAKASTGWR